MTKAYSYIRMSTDIQLKGDSLRRQLELSKSYALEHGLTLDQSSEMKDIGVSAYDGDNVKSGALGKFLKKIEEGKIERGSYLLIESLDRLSRDKVLTALNSFTSIIRAGIKIVTLADGMVYSEEGVEANWAQLVISLTIMSRAHEESLQKSKRISAAWKNKRDALTSKKMTARCPAWLKLSGDRKEFLVISDRVDIVKSIFNDSSNGMGNFTIARRLNERGVKNWGRSIGWQVSYIQKILNNRAVLGEFQPHKLVNKKRAPFGDPIENYFPRIIEEQTFYKVKAEKQKRKLGGGRKGKTLSNLFTGILKCAYCSSSIHFINKGRGPKGGAYLMCDSARRNTGCFKVTWSYKDFEINFLTYFQEINFQEIFGGNQVDEIKNLQDQIIASEGKFSANQKNIDKFAESFFGETTAPQSFADKALALEEENAGLKLEIKGYKEKLALKKDEENQVGFQHEELQQVFKELNSLEGDSLYDLRGKLSQQIKSCIKKIVLFPLGKIEDKKREKDVKKGLIKAGYSNSEIRAYFKSIQKTYNDKKARFYAVYFDDENFRLIRPDFKNPEKLQFMVSVDEKIWISSPPS
ncbi:MAG: recombinase family protein [Nitrospina sp.]|nr:recombinase family protein [Nitrospina sp.]